MHVKNKIRIKFVSGTEKVIRRSITTFYWEVVCFFAKCVSPKLERTARMGYGATKLLLNEDVAKGLFFHNGNTVSLYNRMDSREQRDFPCIWGPQYSWDKVRLAPDPSPRISLLLCALSLSLSLLLAKHH